MELSAFKCESMNKKRILKRLSKIAPKWTWRIRRNIIHDDLAFHKVRKI